MPGPFCFVWAKAGQWRPSTEAEVECVFGQGLSWADAVFDRLVSSPWV